MRACRKTPSDETDLDLAFTLLSQLRAEALLVAADPFFNSRREQLIALTARHALPAARFRCEHALVASSPATARQNDI
jgi:putative ABC transport system substrate-binding protein